MTKNDIMGHWYKCKNKKCDKDIPIPDYIFTTQDGEKTDEIQDECDFCGMIQWFKLSNAGKTCSKEEAQRYYKIQQQIKEGKIKFIAYWEGKKP